MEANDILFFSVNLVALVVSISSLKACFYRHEMHKGIAIALAVWMIASWHGLTYTLFPSSSIVLLIATAISTTLLSVLAANKFVQYCIKIEYLKVTKDGQIKAAS